MSFAVLTGSLTQRGGLDERADVTNFSRTAKCKSPSRAVGHPEGVLDQTSFVLENVLTPLANIRARLPVAYFSVITVTPFVPET
jgi:hypothetical protein